ncbi:MAG: SDR family NAD(P)-dependent oxidoreductase [Planctomycetota bacterium]|nr:SDR family NAD(P)-dependent oxidoreductase [Planctomycetota bacterium]MDA1113099.1 SDR family NAD(P)-dependent oxidoreductase [Planctomycetota bacterium]
MSLPDLTGKVAVITGASRGLGEGIAKNYLARGMKVALCARGEIPFAENDDILTANFDITDEAAVHQFAASAAAKFGSIDLWINNAGVLEPVVKARDLSAEQLRHHLDVNLFGVLYGCQAYLQHVAGRSGQGVLINISSGAAWGGYAGWAAYCMGKAAVDRLTETLALEELENGLHAYAVAPGIIDTAMQATIRASTPEVFPMVDKFHEYKNNDLFNSPDFVADHLLMLSFDEAAKPEQTVVRLPAEKA